MLLKFQTLSPSIIEVLYLVESENYVLVSAIFVARLSYGVLLSLYLAMIEDHVDVLHLARACSLTEKPKSEKYTS